LASATLSGLIPRTMKKRRLAVPPRPAIVSRYGRLIQLLSQPQIPLTVTPVAEIPVLMPDSAVPTLQWMPVGTNDAEWQGELHSVVYLKDLGVRLLWMLPLFPILEREPWRGVVAHALLESHLDTFSELLARIPPDHYEALAHGPRVVYQRVCLFEHHGIWRLQVRLHIAAVGLALANAAVEDLP